MKRLEILFLKITVILTGIPVLAVCILWLPSFVGYLHYPVIIALYATTIPFFFALYQAFKLLSYVDGNKVFSELSEIALKHIKYCAVTISIIYAIIIPFLFPIADADDAPGLVGFPLIFIFASFVIAATADVLYTLVKEATERNSEKLV